MADLFMDPLTHLCGDPLSLNARLAAIDAMFQVRGLTRLTTDTHPAAETPDHKRAVYEAAVTICTFMQALAEDPDNADRTAAELWAAMGGGMHPG